MLLKAVSTAETAAVLPAKMQVCFDVDNLCTNVSHICTQTSLADASTSTAAHIGSFPAVFTSGDLARTIEAAGSWAELPAEHHLSLVGWDDDLEAQAQALSAQLVHTFYPQRLVTKVCAVPIPSMSSLILLT